MKINKSNLTKIPLLAFALLASALLTASCGERFPSWYILELPQPPISWVSFLGEPSWMVEWVDPDGQKQIMLLEPNLPAENGLQANSLQINLPVTWASPVTAWPYWQHHNLIPGLFKPAGAIFPFDANGNRLKLTWEAGVDAVFFWELALANEGNYSRVPSNFDWPRFRDLFTPEILREEICEDPWLANWRSIAERTANGNFDRRRLVPEATEEIEIPVTARTWYGTSPFSKPIVFPENESSIFQIRPGINVWVSEEGILRAYGNVWILSTWNK
ncbi:MAG: hypothetical protein FWC01_03710 [Treponema sp.]|nr:hypothetical protein [Treponema sp.]MCL2237509.1 hypothetical protein [Treponema sp.]